MKFCIIEKSKDELLQESLIHHGNSLTEIPYSKVLNEIKFLLNKLNSEIKNTSISPNSIRIIDHCYPQIFDLDKKDSRCTAWYQIFSSFRLDELANKNRISINSLVKDLVTLKDALELETTYLEVNLLYTNKEHTHISLFFMLDVENYCLTDVTKYKEKNKKMTIEDLVSQIESNKKDIIKIFNANNFNGALKLNPVFERTKNDYDIYRFKIRKTVCPSIIISEKLFLSDFDKKYNFSLSNLYYTVFQHLRYTMEEQLLKDTDLMLTMGYINNEYRIFIASRENIKVTNI